MMRRVLVDHARGRATLSRGGDAKKFALTGLEEAPSATVDVLLLDEALTKLASLHPRHAQVAELRYFGGLTLDECSRALGVSTSTVENDWAMARAWLRRHLEQTSHDPTIG
jgi:RNA polymerase sigma factor (TIGR02999 family)